MFGNFVTAFCFVALLALPLYAQAQQGPQQKETKATEGNGQAKESYEPLVEKLKKGDLTIDFAELRMAFTKTKDFSGYGGLEKKEAFGALDKKDFQKALKLAEDGLKDDYLDLNAHYVAFIANRELDKADKAEFHRNVFFKLIEAIQKSGDGKTPETAFIVIGVDEEYVLINYLGYRPTQQGLYRANGHTYDKLSVVNTKTNETVVFYFQIDTFFGKF